MRITRCVLISFLSLMSACALPPSETKVQDFVPQSDLEVVSLTREGLNYYSRSRYIDAEFKFRKALEIAPDAEKIRYNLALTLIQQGIYSEAEEILLGLLQGELNSTQYEAALAQLAIAQCDYNKAILHYEKAYNIALYWRELSLAGQFARSLAVVYFTIGQEDLALNYSKLALDLIDTPDEMCKHAKLLTALGMASDAYNELIAYVNAKDLKKNSCLMMDLAVAALAKGDYEEASKFSEMGVSLRKVEPSELAVLKLAQFTAEELKGQSKQKVEKTTDTEDDKEKEENLVFENFNNGKPLETNYAVYWPLKFLEFLKIKSDERETEEVEEGLLERLM